MSLTEKTVVIGGIISSTLLTLLVLPGLYRMTWQQRELVPEGNVLKESIG